MKQKEVGDSRQTARQEVVLGQPCRLQRNTCIQSFAFSLFWVLWFQVFAVFLLLTFFFNSFGGRGQGLDLKIKQ